MSKLLFKWLCPMVNCECKEVYFLWANYGKNVPVHTLRGTSISLHLCSAVIPSLTTELFPPSNEHAGQPVTIVCVLKTAF